MLDTGQYYKKDQVSSTSFRFGYDVPQPAITMGDGEKNNFDFLVYVNTEGFDNDDNAYGRFVLHMYTNMEDQNDTYTEDKGQSATYYDIEVPLEKCSGDGMDVNWRNRKIFYYCPRFGPDHFLYGGFWGIKYSKMRMGLHLCDNSTEATEKRKAEGKVHWKCKPEEEIYNYFNNEVIIGLESYSTEASIT